MRLSGVIGGEPPVDRGFFAGDLWHQARLPSPEAELKRVAVLPSANRVRGDA
jgi:hypothetical protein